MNKTATIVGVGEWREHIFLYCAYYWPHIRLEKTSTGARAYGSILKSLKITEAWPMAAS